MADQTHPSTIYEDASVLVINKPAGMIVNRADTVKNVATVQDWVEAQFRTQNSEFKMNKETDFIKRSGIVHRLDKETSGLLLLAKTEAAFVHLQKQFRERAVLKTYVALVHGKVEPRDGVIDVPIGRLPWNRMRFGVLAGGREAKTLYKVVQILYIASGNAREPLSLVEAYPKTGRTHQIRAHFLHIGHPLFADELYAGRKTKKKDRQLLPRHFLHASAIEFMHPETEKGLKFSQPLPQDLQSFLSTLVQITE